MGMNETPSGNRVHIALFGRTNAGKSSLMNAITGQNISVVSALEGTTTDPVRKTMELLPLGPVVMIDTPGLDDDSQLGELREEKTREVLASADMAILVVDATEGMKTADYEALKQINQREIPYILVYNKFDLCQENLPVNTDLLQGIESIDQHIETENIDRRLDQKITAYSIQVSATTGYHIHELKETLARLKPVLMERPLVKDLVKPGDLVVLVIPIDKAAPKGRLILPQQQVLRELLDCGAISIVARETELSSALASLQKKPALVITDSQAFAYVSKVVPEDIPLTSFSILFARHKGVLQYGIQGIRFLQQLKSGDKILIAEGCTHHRQCGDIGTDKLPAWIREACGTEDLEFVFTSGREFPKNLDEFAFVLICGSCMLTTQEVMHRYKQAVKAGIPVSNYGIAIASMKGILERSIQMLKDIE